MDQLRPGYQLFSSEGERYKSYVSSISSMWIALERWCTSGLPSTNKIAHMMTTARNTHTHRRGKVLSSPLSDASGCLGTFVDNVTDKIR